MQLEKITINEMKNYLRNVKKHPVLFGSMTNSRESKCLYFTQTYNVDVYGFVRPHKGNYGRCCGIRNP